MHSCVQLSIFLSQQKFQAIEYPYWKEDRRKLQPLWTDHPHDMPNQAQELIYKELYLLKYKFQVNTV